MIINCIMDFACIVVSVYHTVETTVTYVIDMVYRLEYTFKRWHYYVREIILKSKNMIF